MSEIKELSLMKKTESFIFRYEPGSEEELLDTFVALANDRGNNFDWFDAAVLSFQLSKDLVAQADTLLGIDNTEIESETSRSQSHHHGEGYI